MKTKYTLIAGFAFAALQFNIAQGQEALIAWDDAPETGSNTEVVDYAANHILVTGFTGVVNDGRQAVAFQGSTDGTFGSLTIPGITVAESGRFELRDGSNNADARLRLTITNGTDSDYDLDALVFDFARQNTNSPTAFSVDYLQFASGKSLGENNVQLLSELGLVVTDAGEDFPDYSANIAILDDNTLAAGESAVFSITASDSSGFAQALVDNIAFTGAATTIPEPSGYALLAGMLAITSVMLRRRK
jgi:hypothetical protein